MSCFFFKKINKMQVAGLELWLVYIYRLDCEIQCLGTEIFIIEFGCIV